MEAGLSIHAGNPKSSPPSNSQGLGFRFNTYPTPNLKHVAISRVSYREHSRFGRAGMFHPMPQFLSIFVNTYLNSILENLYVMLGTAW